jgi:hypothetical protein
LQGPTTGRRWSMAGDRIDPKQVAFFFEAYPGVNWIAEGIPLLPGNGSPHERDLNALIAPIEVLKVYGSSVELIRKFKAVQQAAIVNRDLPMYDGNRARIASCFDELAGHILRLAKVARNAETLLANMGWKFDPEKKKVRQKGRRHRGKDFFSEIVWAFYAARYSDKGNTAPVRRKLSRELAKYFYESDKSELSPASGALIYAAIYNRERNPK